jgi:CheY-like chemotaxis protein
MSPLTPLPPVLMADDDLDDCSLATDAFKMAKVGNPLRCLNDGEKLIEYLRECLAQQTCAPCFPVLILLDLNMPRMDGRETLLLLKSDPDLRHIPVVVWTTSRSEDDVRRARAAGCDDYVIKPSSFTELVGIVRALDQRWLVANDRNGAAR